MSESADDNGYPADKFYKKITTKDGIRIPIKSLMRIDPENLEGEYSIQASWQATIGWETNIAEIDVGKQERVVKQMESKLFIKFRSKGEGRSRLSIDECNHRVQDSSELKEEYSRLFDLKERLSLLKTCSMAMATKKDMLINLGAEVRQSRRSV